MTTVCELINQSISRQSHKLPAIFKNSLKETFNANLNTVFSNSPLVQHWFNPLFFFFFSVFQGSLPVHSDWSAHAGLSQHGLPFT